MRQEPQLRQVEESELGVLLQELIAIARAEEQLIADIKEAVARRDDNAVLTLAKRLANQSIKGENCAAFACSDSVAE